MYYIIRPCALVWIQIFPDLIYCYILLVEYACSINILVLSNCTRDQVSDNMNFGLTQEHTFEDTILYIECETLYLRGLAIVGETDGL